MSKITTNPHNSQNWKLESSYDSLPNEFYTHLAPIPVKAPNLVIFNSELAKTLGFSFNETNIDDLAQLFSGNILPEGATPIAQAYAGHQFGHFNMLGDGRAHLLGEQIAPDGKNYDIQLKGSGQTPYSRRGDGRAALAPMLREYLISEAMHALGVPTTRSLAVVTTGEPVFRHEMLQGAILTRVASSHIRVGTFEYASTLKDREALKRLADYAIMRHYPELTQHNAPYLAFLTAVIERQAKLVAAWLHIGFIHGVMNTDNMTISGETIDYGPCAFMDNFAMDTVFSSIDYNGRYAFGNQGSIAKWNLARFAETLLPLLHEDIYQAAELAEAEIERYNSIFNEAWLAGMRCKMGLIGEQENDLPLIQSLLEFMQQTGADYTITFRNLISDNIPVGEIYQSAEFKAWHKKWRDRLLCNHNSLESSFNLMRANNPVIIPRNQHVEDALAGAEEGNLKPFQALLQAVQHPFTETETNIQFRKPPAHTNQNYQTFCGT
jgi:serine/tyrosine/threonine adenylyltransferase